MFNVKKNMWVSNFENYKLVNNVKNDEEFNYQFKRHFKKQVKIK